MEAKVTHLHKGCPSEKVNNHRPISIWPVLSEVLEKHVQDRLSDFLHFFKFLHKTGHSYETALIHMIDS